MIEGPELTLVNFDNILYIFRKIKIFIIILLETLFKMNYYINIIIGEFEGGKLRLGGIQDAPSLCKSLIHLVRLHVVNVNLDSNSD